MDAGVRDGRVARARGAPDEPATRTCPPDLAAGGQEKGLQEVAAEAVGKAFGALHSTDEISYRDAKHLLAHDTATVMALLRACGPGAFEEPEPADDFGLGVVYGTVREALLDEGYLLEEA